ncbi:MAG: lipid-A-disaccharide synthase [Nitrospirales bacterium]|nr:MAG: lipid-A-disaccharide synthase [Nitrospirales bacterium]
MKSSPRILIVTGEASGDLHGANLAKELYRLHSQIHIDGVGGQRMSAEGVRLLPGIESVDAIGVPGLTQLRRGVQLLRRLKKILREETYDAVVLIDSPGMNLRLAKTAVKANQHVIYYIAPQIWAWGARRLNVIQRAVSRMLVIFPFEESLYRQAGVPCNFVGHPLLDEVDASYDQTIVRQQLHVPKGARVLGLLPGSREHEVERCLPTMLEAAWEVKKAFPDIHITIAKSSSVSHAGIHDKIKGFKSLQISVVDNQPNEVMAAADLLFVASGTATLQAAIIGTPMLVLYRVPWLTYAVARLLIKIPYIGLVNIVAGRRIVPEFIQHDMTVKHLVPEALRLLHNPQLLEDMRRSFQDVREALGDPGASRRAAECVLAEVEA